MARKPVHHSVPVSSLFVAFCAGGLVMWALYSYGPPKPVVPVRAQLDGDTEPRSVAVDARPNVGASDAKTSRSPAVGAERVVATTGAAKDLRVPIDGADVTTWKGGFTERRGNRAHEAVDILAPRNTPIHAVSDGTIAKLFLSKAGGTTIYQFDPSGQLAYYYAHLERYADGLHEGQPVSKGDIIGYVGTSGNAPPNTPHLHFGVFQLDQTHRWWQGKPVDPYEVFHK
jgi:murein DD-endopeptidase MepM/ murein hydrolase activator NlpD